MEKEIQDFLVEKKRLTEKLKVWVKDKSIPLETRWDTFVDSGLGRQDGYYYNFKSLDEDDFHSGRNKYQMLDVTDVIRHFDNPETTEEEINAFKEEALNDFIFSWEFDW